MLICAHARIARFVAISLAIEDTDGQAQMLSVYNLPGAFLASLDTLDELLPPGTVLVLREPTLKMDNEGQNAFIRVDSPTDVVFLTDDHPIARGARWRTNAPRSRLPNTAEAWKERGNVHFKHGRHFAASIAYTRGLQREPSSRPLLLNRALTYINLEYYSAALVDVHAVLADPTVAGTDRIKALFRTGRAHYGCKDYALARREFDAVLALDPQQHNSRDWSKRCEQRIRETQQGDPGYDWVQMFKDSQANPRLDVADWVGPVEVASIPARGGGRGVVTTKAVEVGELLVSLILELLVWIAELLQMVFKPYAAAFPPRDTTTVRELLTSVNMMTNEGNEHQQVEVIACTIAKIMAEPSSAHLVSDLYAGPDSPPPPSTYPVTSRPSDVAITPPVNNIPIANVATRDIDVLHIDRVCSFNNFGPNSVKPATFRMGASETSQPCGSALYTLPSLVNHACAGTAMWTCFGDVLVIRATQALKAGEEVTMPYTSGDSYLDRSTRLKKHIVICDCWLCAQERLDGEERCRERKRLVDAAQAKLLASPDRPIPEARAFVKALAATYRPETAHEIKPSMMIAYGQLAYALGLKALRQPSMYGEVAEAHMQVLESAGIVVTDKTVRGSIPSLSRKYLPIATTRVVAVNRHETVMSAVMISASFCSMDDLQRARRWLKAAKWREFDLSPSAHARQLTVSPVNNAIVGGGDALFRVQYDHVLKKTYLLDRIGV